MTAMQKSTLQLFPNDVALAAAVAENWLDSVAAAATARTKHLVALSGGRSAKLLFAALVAQAVARQADFTSVEFFWADERCVPPNDPESNFRLARECMLDQLGIRETQVHRILGEIEPEAAAEAATATLRRVANAPEKVLPVLDLVLLGMGEDGHVASLFPGDEAALADHVAVFRPVRNSPKPPPKRVTLGLGAIIAAREVWVLVTGAAKAPALRDALSPLGQTPLAQVIQHRQTTRIFSDVEPR
jgi:6-phosphogluconolactonase